MGCDIHCYIEYHDGHDRWSGFGGRINPGRDYQLFGLLAGVRGAMPPLIPPRGMPTDAGYSANHDNELAVATSQYPDGTDSDKAAEWVANGVSKWARKGFVTHPDWHTHSWLTLDEFERVLTAYYVPTGQTVSPQYCAVREAMRELAKGYGAARLVFWFDN